MQVEESQNNSECQWSHVIQLLVDSNGIILIHHLVDLLLNLLVHHLIHDQLHLADFLVNLFAYWAFCFVGRACAREALLQLIISKEVLILGPKNSLTWRHKRVELEKGARDVK